MLLRIVRLELQKEKVQDFVQLFKENKEKIASSAGCHHLEMCTDAKYPHVIYTFSKWDSEDSLNNYRKSDFFSILWPQITALFSGKPQVFSLIQQNEQ